MKEGYCFIALILTRGLMRYKLYLLPRYIHSFVNESTAVIKYRKQELFQRSFYARNNFRALSRSWRSSEIVHLAKYTKHLIQSFIRLVDTRIIIIIKHARERRERTLGGNVPLKRLFELPLDFSRVPASFVSTNDHDYRSDKAAGRRFFFVARRSECAFTHCQWPPRCI